MSNNEILQNEVNVERKDDTTNTSDDKQKESEKLELEKAKQKEREKLELEKAKQKEREKLQREKEKQKEREKLQREKEKQKEREKLQREKEKQKEREKLQREKEKQKEREKLQRERAKQKEREKLQREKAKQKEREKLQREKEKQKEREKLQREKEKQKERERLQREKAKQKEREAMEKEKEKVVNSESSKQSENKDKSFDSLFTKQSSTSKDSESGESEGKVVIDNLQKLREQIFAQKRLERELMEREAKKVQELDQKIISKVPSYGDESLFEVNEDDSYQLEKELETEKSRANFFEQENLNLSKRLAEIEDNFNVLLNLQYKEIEIIDKDTLQLSSSFQEAINNELNRSVLDEFSNMQKELNEIRNIYSQKEENDLLLRKRIEEFQNQYNQKQQEVNRLRDQIIHLESTMPELNDTLKSKENLDKLKQLYEIQKDESLKLYDQLQIYEEEITKLNELNLQSSENEMIILAQLDLKINELNKALQELELRRVEISDSKDEIFKLNEQISSLEKELSTNKDSKELIEKIQVLENEVESLTNELELANQKFVTESSKFNETITKLSKNEKSILAKLDQKDKQIDSQKKQIAEFKKDIGSLNKTIDKLESEIKDLQTNTGKQFEEQLKVLTDENSSLEQSIQEKDVLLANKNHEYEELNNHFKVLEDELEALKQKENDYELLNNEFNALKKEYEDTLNLVSEKANEYKKLSNQYLEVKNELDNALSTLAEKTQGYDELVSEKDRLKEQLEEANHNANQKSADYEILYDEFIDMKNAQNDSLVSLEQKIRDYELLKVEYDNLENDLNEKEAEIEKLNESFDKLEKLVDDYSDLEKALNEKEEEVSKIKLLNSDLEKTLLEKEDLVNSINEQLSINEKNNNELNASLEKTKEEYAKLEELLKGNNEQIKVFVNNEKVLVEKLSVLETQYNEEIQSLKETNASLLAELEKYNTLDKDLENIQNDLSEKEQQVKALNEEIDNYKALLEKETKDLKSDVEAKEQEIQYSQKEIANLENNILELELKIESLQKAYENSHDEEILRLNKEIEAIEQKLSQECSDNQDLKESIEHKDSLLSSLQEKLEYIELENIKLENKVEEYEELVKQRADNIEAKREAFGHLEEKLFSLESEVSTLKNELSQKDELILELSELIESNEHTIKELEETNSRLTISCEEIKQVEISQAQSNLDEKENQIAALIAEKDELSAELEEQKNKIIDLERVYSSDKESFENKINGLKSLHETEISNEKKLYDNLIQSYQNQMNQERQVYDEMIKRLEEKVNDFSSLEAQVIALRAREAAYLQELETKNIEINNLKSKINDVEEDNTSKTAVSNLEKQMNEILERLNQKDEPKVDSTQPSSMQHTPFYSQMPFSQSTDLQIEQLKDEFKKELALRDRLIEFIKEDRVRQEPSKTREAEYIDEINSLKEKVNELIKIIEISNTAETEPEDLPVADSFIENEEENFEQLTIDSDEEDYILEYESVNQDEIEELNVLIEQKESFVKELLDRRKESPLENLTLEGDLKTRASTIISMYNVIEQRVKAEGIKYEESLSLLNERTINKHEEVRIISKKLNELNYEYNSNPSYTAREKLEQNKTKLYLELQQRQEDIRILVDEDPLRIKSKYLSFLREKEAQLLKLEDETESILENYSLRQQRIEELKRINKMKEEALVETKPSVDVEALEQDLEKDKQEHQRLYDNLVELRKELDKRKEVEMSMRSYPNVLEYLNTTKTLEELNKNYQENYEQKQILLNNLEVINPNTNREEYFKTKGSIGDKEIIESDLLTKKDYLQRHLDELLVNKEVKSYQDLIDNINKINNIVKQHLDRLQNLKDNITQKEKNIKEAQGKSA